jgi:outer membrane receptor for monomeric catechols
MPAATFSMIAVAAACLLVGALPATAQQPRHAPASDHATPYKASRLSSPRATEPIPNIPGQTTVLTREVLDDMKATSVRDALRSTAGVTLGR